MMAKDKKEYKEIITKKEAGGGMKFDQGKLEWSLLPLEVMEPVIRRLTEGRKKYEKNSWQLLQDGVERYENAFFRHWYCYKTGDRWDNDPRFQGDNATTHLQACLTNLIFLVWFELQEIKKENDGK